MTTHQQALEKIVRALKKAGSRNTSGHDWFCPVHEIDGHSHTASLTMKRGAKPGRILLRCAKCETKEVLKRLRLTPKDLTYDAPTRPTPGGAPEVHDFPDAEGHKHLRVRRQRMTDGSKRITQQHWNGSAWKSGVGGKQRVLYDLPRVLKAAGRGHTVHLTEGESDADALNEWFERNGKKKHLATTHPEGAGKWRADYARDLAGAARVVVWADRDAAGYTCAAQRFSAVQAAGIPVELRLPVPDHDKADVRDHLAAGFPPSDGKRISADDLELLTSSSADDEALLEIVARQLLTVATADTARDHLADALTDDDVARLPEQRFVIDGWVPAGAYTTIYGPPGIGKTLVLLGMHRAVRKGTRWQDQPTVRGLAVSYVGEEVHQLQNRIKAWDEGYPIREGQAMSPGYTVRAMVDLTHPAGVAAVIRTVRELERRSRERIALLTFDPLVEYMTGDENGEAMDKVTRGLRTLATLLDCGVVVGHHTNAAESRARGADHLRMRCGAHVRMESLDESGQRVGLLQEKQRNAGRSALVLEHRTQGASVVLEWTHNFTAQDYADARTSAVADRKERAKETRALTARSDREQEILRALSDAASDGSLPISQSKLFGVVGGNRGAFGAALSELQDRGIVGVASGGAGRAKLIDLNPEWLAASMGDA